MLSDVLIDVSFAFLLLFSDSLHFSPVLAHISSSQQFHIPLAQILLQEFHLLQKTGLSLQPIIPTGMPGQAS